MNSVLWDLLNGGDYKQEDIDALYRDICILAVLSGIEIDKAKRAYQNIDVAGELENLLKRHACNRPQFFEIFDDEDIERQVRYVSAKDIEDKAERRKENKRLRAEKRKELKDKKHYTFYRTAMEYVYQLASEIDCRAGKPKSIKYVKISQLLKEPSKDKNSTAYAKRDSIVKLCESYRKELNVLYKELGMSDDDERDMLYEKIQEKKKERNEKVHALLTNEYVLYLVLKHYDKGDRHDWQLYAPLLNNPLFASMLKESKGKLFAVVEDEQGDYSVYGNKYKKQEN